MNPTKAERKARRSSILKPPKPRQPLQNVDLAASSTENSPATTTTKIKRRVSFAEKKHVKEFCDSMEQGTVWDNTYEESESSNVKHQSDENIIGNEIVNHEIISEKSTYSLVTESAITITQSVTTESTKIFTDTVFSSDVHVKTTGIPFPANHAGSFNARRSLSVTEKVFRSSTNKRMSALAESVVTDASKNSVADSASFVPPSLPNDDCNEVSMDETLIENASMETTLPTSLTLSKDEPLLRSSFAVMPTMDFSRNDPISSRRVSTKSRESLIAQDKENINVMINPMELKINQKKPEEIRVYHDNSMEMTEAVSNRMSVIRNQKPMKLLEKESSEKALSVAEEKTTFQMKAAETVTKIAELSNSKEVNQSEIDLRPDRMSMLHKSLNPGEARKDSSLTSHQPLSEKTIFHDEPQDFAEAELKIRSSGETRRRKSEGTMVFHDSCLELTEAVPNVPNTDRLQKLHDEPLNQREIPNVSIIGKLQENLREISPEKTSIFYNQPVEMTEVVRSRLSYGKPAEEKTTIFHNQLVDMTEVVRSRSNSEKPREISPEKTSIFCNQPVEMTEVVRSRFSCGKTAEEKTTIFHNQPVDMTEVIRSRSDFEKLPEEKTTIFHNQPVDMTEVVRSRTSSEKPRDSSTEKTSIFYNQPVEMTEVVKSRASFANPLTGETMMFEKHPPEKTTIFDNVSVDMTEAVGSRVSYGKQLPERTTIFHNQPVDMTEVVRSRSNFEKHPPEKTTIFDNVSVDMTEVVRSRPDYEKLPEEKTTIFQNQPVDMTEAVRGRSHLEKYPPEKTTIFDNVSVDMTEAVGSRVRYEKHPPEKTTIFQNQSIDTTEAVRTDPSICKSLLSMPERSTMLQNKSMDASEMILSDVNIPNSTQQLLERETSCLRSQRTSASHKTSVADGTQHEPPQNPTHRFLERENSPVRSQRISASHKESIVDGIQLEPSKSQSLETTESESRVPGVSKFLTRDSCTLADERITKQKALNAEEANRIFASIEMKIGDPEVRSPVAKRMKSLGSRKSIDFTAAIPFIAYRKLARKKCNEINAENSAQHVEGSSHSEALGDKLDTPQPEVQPSTNDPLSTFPVGSAEIISREKEAKSTNFLNNSMQMTEAIPSLNSYESRKCLDSQDPEMYELENTICKDDSMEMTRAIPGILKATIFHDQSMELTRAVSHRPIVDNIPVNDENSVGKANRRYVCAPNVERENLFRDESMELTRAVQNEQNQIFRKEAESPWSKTLAQLEQDGKVRVHADDSMEITNAVPFPLQNQTQALNKENYPLVPKDAQSPGFPRSESEARTGISRNEFLEILQSVPFLSTQKNKENRAQHTDMEELSRESEEITGVVPFPTQIEDEDSPEVGRVASPMRFESQKMEMTEAVGSSSNAKIGKSESVCDDLHPRLSEMEAFSPMEALQTRHSVAKELFQKPVVSEKSKAAHESIALGSETADLQAEIRKLAETFALSNSVDESGFDQATFLKQQARCMEDYEANSTASQEYNTASMLSKKNASYAEERRSPDPGRADQDSVGAPGPTLPTASWEVGNAGISESNPNSSVRNSSSGMSRSQYDKSLEELRCRAQSVSKFRPEMTGFELTAAISIADPGKHYQSIFEENPPSFVFSDTLEDSVTDDLVADPIIDGAASASELPIEPRYSIDRMKMQSRLSAEMGYEPFPEITETVNILRKNEPEVEETDIAEVTMTAEEEADGSAGPSKSGKIKGHETRHRSQTFVIKRPNTDPTVVSSIPTEDKEARNDRLSGLTTAAEFSSETPDGPSEKIRRRESELPDEESRLPTVGKEGNATELIGIGRSWGNKDFVNSTAIGDDITRQFVRQDTKDASIMLMYPSPEELPSQIVQDDDRTTDLRPGIEKTDDTMEISVPKSPFAVLKETIERLDKSAETIWNINRLDEKIVAFDFFSQSIVLAIYLNEDPNSTKPIKVIGLLSQLIEEGTDPGSWLAHQSIMKKFNSASLTQSYRTYEDVPSLLDHVSTEVKLGMDFLFELERLRNRFVMDIQGDRITFMARSSDINAGIILEITMTIRKFEDINSNDITVDSILGGEKVSQNYIKRLITNVTRDHRFLRFYINDVRNYIDLMAESGFSNGNEASEN